MSGQLKTYQVKQTVGKEINIYLVKASSKESAKKAAIAKGADASKKMTVAKW